MVKKRRWVLAVIIPAALMAAAVLGFRPALMALGRHELYSIARDKGYCTGRACDDGIAYVTALLHSQSGLPADAIPWCMAANTIYFTDFSFANAIKDKFANWMYQSCENDSLTLDDATITIGGPQEE